jgi:hypothetical protein
MKNTMNISKNTIPTNILNNKPSNLRCIKYKRTKLALKQAIPKATAIANCPASTQVTVIVSAVRNNKAIRIFK